MQKPAGGLPFANPRSARRIVHLATLLGVILSGALFVGGLISALRAAREASWRQVTADIEHVAASDYAYQTSNGRSRTGTRISVTYRYTVGGETYFSSRFRTDEPYDDYTEAGGDAAEARLAALAEQKQLTAYVSPDDPAQAVLEREELVPAVVVTTIGGLVLVFLLGVYVRWRLFGPTPPPSPAA